ncbi:MAG: hypothetical protein HDT16_03510 [Oscillibacter sp.]|nr:hypothetical protein [Oscillibacter sp.]
MQYPINVEKYIAVSRLLYGVNLDNEDAYRKLIPIVNACYAAGLRGEGGFPLDAADEFQATAEALGCPVELVMRNDTANRVIPPMIKWFNRAYEQGRRDAESG